MAGIALFFPSATDLFGDGRCGSLDARLYSNPLEASQTGENLPVSDQVWRVATREGRWFTVELAATFVRDDTFAQLLADTAW